MTDSPGKIKTIIKLYLTQAAIADPALTKADVAVLGIIIELYRFDRGYAWGSIDLIRRVAGLSERAVCRSLARLEEREYLTVRRHGGRALTNHYVPRWDRFQQSPLAGRVHEAITERRTERSEFSGNDSAVNGPETLTGRSEFNGTSVDPETLTAAVETLTGLSDKLCQDGHPSPSSAHLNSSPSAGAASPDVAAHAEGSIDQAITHGRLAQIERRLNETSILDDVPWLEATNELLNGIADGAIAVLDDSSGHRATRLFGIVADVLPVAKFKRWFEHNRADPSQKQFKAMRDWRDHLLQSAPGSDHQATRSAVRALVAELTQILDAERERKNSMARDRRIRNRKARSYGY